MKSSLLQQPYPLDTSWKKQFRSALFFGFFIFLFLMIFQPFGLSSFQSENKTTIIGGYGLITTLTILLNYILAISLFPKWFSRLKWTIGKNILFTTWVFFTIGSVNLLYSVKLGFLNLSVQGFLSYQLITLGVGIIPVILSTLWVYNNRLKKALKEAGQLNNSIQPHEASHELIEIPSKNKSEELRIEIDQLLAIKAVENYIEVYLIKEGKETKKILRNTLKEVESTLNEFQSIQRCHRSYLVNLDQVKSFSGNAQGLSLSFKKAKNIQVPVSRSFVAEIKAKL